MSRRKAIDKTGIRAVWKSCFWLQWAVGTLSGTDGRPVNGADRAG
jgi:hypothetical protein